MERPPLSKIKSKSNPLDKYQTLEKNNPIVLSQLPFPFPAALHLPPIYHPQLTASSSRKEALSAEKRPGILRGDHGSPPSLRAEAAQETRAAKAVARQGQTVPERLFTHGVSPALGLQVSTKSSGHDGQYMASYLTV
jgi:hypothetical protein